VTAPRAGRGRPGWPMAAHQLASAYKMVGARQLVRQAGGWAAHFTVRNRCNLPRRAHQLAGRLRKMSTRRMILLASRPIANKKGKVQSR